MSAYGPLKILPGKIIGGGGTCSLCPLDPTPMCWVNIGPRQYKAVGQLLTKWPNVILLIGLYMDQYVGYTQGHGVNSTFGKHVGQTLDQNVGPTSRVLE